MNLLRVMYLLVHFVVELEIMARTGEVPCLGLSQARSKKSRLFGAGFIWTKKTQITFLLFRLCLSRRCGSIARVNTRNRANARALESFLVVPSVLSTSPTCRIERALSDRQLSQCKK